MNVPWGKCGGCRFWDQTKRTAAFEWIEAECRRRAPYPSLEGSMKHRQFPITKGMETCGDYQPAGKEFYRADYAEELGPWITLR